VSLSSLVSLGTSSFRDRVLPGEPFREEKVVLVSIVLLQDLTLKPESLGGKVKEPAGVGGEEEEAILSGDSAEVGIDGGVGGAVSGNDDVAGEPDGESGGDGGVGWFERVIPLCPYVHKFSFYNRLP